jgi:hypothetical protein
MEDDKERITNMLDDFETDKDAPNVRVVAVGKNKIIARRTDPFGFWSLAFERGALPEWLQGSYTSYDQAFLDIQKYISTVKDNPVPAPERTVDVLRIKAA